MSPKERTMARRSRSDSRWYAEQIARDAHSLTHEAIALAYLIDRVSPIGESLGKRLGPKVRGVRDLLHLAKVELRETRLQYLAPQDPLAQDGNGPEIAKALAEAQASVSHYEKFHIEPRLKRFHQRRAGAKAVVA